MKLLIIKPSSLGDIIHAFPAVAELHAALPDANITWVANDSLASIVQLYPGVTIIPFPRKEVGKFNLAAIRNFIRKLKTEQYDAVIDFQGLLRSGLMCHFARKNAKSVWGFKAAREGSRFFYDHPVTTPPELRHAADKNRWLAKEFLKGIGATPAAVPPEAQLVLPESWTAEADLIAKEYGLEEKADGPILAVGCSSRWESKSWPTDFFASVLQAVTHKVPQLRIWLLGSPDEVERAEAVKTAAGLDNLVNLAGKTSLGALTGLLKRSNVLLTNDSGPMHLAAALTTPCVAFFGSTDPTLTGPYGPEGRHCVIRSRCQQSPCLKRQCPRGNTPCCSGIDPAEVAAAIIQRL